MMYLLLSIALCCVQNAFAHRTQTDTTEIPLAPTQESAASAQHDESPEADLSTDTNETRTIAPIAQEIDLQYHAQIYKRLLRDLDKLDNEDFADESLREAVRAVLQDQIAVTKKVLDHEDPALAEQVEKEHAAPRKRLIIIGTVAVLVVGAGIFALFSYNPVTGTWGKPRAANAKATLGRIADRFAHAFDETPETSASTAAPTANPQTA
jgi:hypothetical protein